MQRRMQGICAQRGGQSTKIEDEEGDAIEMGRCGVAIGWSRRSNLSIKRERVGIVIKTRREIGQLDVRDDPLSASMIDRSGRDGVRSPCNGARG